MNAAQNGGKINIIINNLFVGSTRAAGRGEQIFENNSKPIGKQFLRPEESGDSDLQEFLRLFCCRSRENLSSHLNLAFSSRS